MSDLVGMTDARFALEVAAAGGHHLMLSGPKGAGKTSLAERIPGILPDLDVDEALELTAICSLSGVLDIGDGLVTSRPFFAPHHSSTRVSLLGGGTGKVRSEVHTSELQSLMRISSAVFCLKKKQTKCQIHEINTLP